MSSSGTAVVTAASLRGVEAQLVTVEVSLSGGLPGLDVVGMPDSAVLEARSRVRCAIRASGFTLPRAHATINLAPSELRKSGTAYDLAIAVALLIATSQLPQTVADGLLFVGELALDGSVCPVRGDMAYVMLAQETGLDLVVSAESPLPGGGQNTYAGSDTSHSSRAGRIRLFTLPGIRSRRPAPLRACRTLETSRTRSSRRGP